MLHLEAAGRQKEMVQMVMGIVIIVIVYDAIAQKKIFADRGDRNRRTFLM